MSLDDAQRWNRKWSDMGEPAAPSDLLRRHRHLLRGGLAADVACGLGQNTLWLARQGYQCLGLDVSDVALGEARQRAGAQRLASSVQFVCCDLRLWPLAPASLDLICVFRFLERALFPDIQRSLRPGGLLFYETRHRGILERRPDSNAAYLLQRGELAQAFPELERLTYDEGPENARLVARKAPGTVSRETITR